MILDSNKVDILLNYFLDNPSKHIHTMNMTKIIWSDVDCLKVKNIVDTLIKELGFSNFNIVGDNYFYHSKSYFPHCDLIHNSNFNVLIPLQLNNPIADQKFIIFDQKWMGNSQTWIGHLETNTDFLHNKLSKDRPCDSTLLEGNTNNQCPQYIIDNMDMTYLSEDYLFGLSGKVLSWVPGHIILFDSRHIHATGRMQCQSKIGLSIRITL